MINNAHTLYQGCIQIASDITRENPQLGAEAQLLIAPLAACTDPIKVEAAARTLSTWRDLLHTVVVFKPCPK